MPQAPRLPATLVVQLLERTGFVTTRIHGRHRIMRHPDGRCTTLPADDDRQLAQGTLQAILLDVGMTRHPPVFLRLATAIRRRISRSGI
ncbi:addiction module toxin, HicA family [Nonomuraea phyllanthi]|uniref:type II toxin-antitoxin system HicA family toxin n=1 Tax=Nonomuraea phyllanthi TaxID=2219224 RepID=UPI0012931154|nr:type II toxin-antitoxin system HicA family toxin [Nonomuraea phyllanthi]QFY06148.1 addiction module toxin, HicA family [Nonomuraea phyllanthi]